MCLCVCGSGHFPLIPPPFLSPFWLLLTQVYLLTELSKPWFSSFVFLQFNFQLNLNSAFL